MEGKGLMKYTAETLLEALPITISHRGRDYLAESTASKNVLSFTDGETFKHTTQETVKYINAGIWIIKPLKELIW